MAPSWSPGGLSWRSRGDLSGLSSVFGSPPQEPGFENHSATSGQSVLFVCRGPLRRPVGPLFGRHGDLLGCPEAI
eukprot:7508313-Pyramimonas_sp.AAC.1